MKRSFSILLTFAILFALVGIPLLPAAAASYPTFSIVSVVTDTSVTIKTSNLPANDSFDVLMNKVGTLGVGGTKVATQASGTGGSQTFTYNIPAGLKGSYQIAIRMQSNTGSGYYAYNWFYNSSTAAVTTTPSPTTTPAPTAVPGYTGYPTFSITAVVKDTSVTVLTANLPKSTSFDVLMGKMGTLGVGGTKVTTIDSGTGGAQTLTFTIPSSLKGAYQISIRLQSSTGSGYYAYNWFYNADHP